MTIGGSEPDETEALLASYASGDLAVIGRLLDRYRPFLRRVVQLRLDPCLRGRVDPSDVVQETQMEAMRRMREYVLRRPMSFRVWLHQTACQRLQMVRRYHRGAQRRTVDREVSLPEESSIALAQSLLGESPSQRLSRQELAERVRQAVSRLAPLDREILMLRNFEELTNQESAEILAIDSVAASKRYGRALLRLRDALSATGPLD